MINKDVCTYLKTKLNKQYFADEITKVIDKTLEDI